MKLAAVLNQALMSGLYGLILVNILRPTDFEQELGFYGAYHQDPVNQLIHFFCIPIILWTAFVWFSYSDILGLKLKVGRHRITWGTLVYLSYLAYYVKLDAFGGGVFAFVLTAMYAIGHFFVERELAQLEKAGPNAKAEKAAAGSGLRVWHVAAAAHVLAWYLQVHPGHAVMEGVKPALFDSFAQALTVAPLFAFYEGIWFAGFQANLRVHVIDLVAKERLRMCKSGGDFIFCDRILQSQPTTTDEKSD